MVIADHQARIPARSGDPIQLTGDTRTAYGSIYHDGQAFPAEVINHVQHPEPTPVFQRVRHAVEQPPLLRALWDRHGRPRSDGSFAAATLAHSQTLFTVDPIEFLPVHLPALSPKQQVQPPITESAAAHRTAPSASLATLCPKA